MGSDCDAEHPSRADYYQFNVRAGDVLVLGTDGLFDNLFNADILHDRDGGAQGLADLARLVSRDGHADTPFARASGWFTGGKCDDITCVVAEFDLSGIERVEVKEIEPVAVVANVEPVSMVANVEQKDEVRTVVKKKKKVTKKKKTRSRKR